MENTKPGPVRRVRVRWQDGEWSISDERRVPEMVIPNSQTLPRTEKDVPIVGFWFEVADSEGNLLYRRIMNDPLKQSVEIRDRDGTFTNVPVRRTDVTFEVLIPDHPENARLSFFGVEEDIEARKVTTGKMAELDLRGGEQPGRKKRRKKR